MPRPATNRKKTAIRQRLDELHMTQTELAKRTGKTVTLINHFCIHGIKTLRIAKELAKTLMCTPMELMDDPTECDAYSKKKSATPYMLDKGDNAYQEFTEEIEKIIAAKVTEFDDDGKPIGVSKERQKEMILALQAACEQYGVPVKLMLAVTRMSAMCDLSIISNILLSDRKIIAMLDRVADLPNWWRAFRMHLFNPAATHAEIGHLLGLSREQVTHLLRNDVVRDSDLNEEYFAKV